MKIDKLRIENEKELEKCKPALEEAERAINELSKDNITELRTFVAPPKVVELALRCVFLFLGHNVKADFEWSWAKTILADLRFLDYLKKYDKQKIPHSTLMKVKPIILSSQFDPADMTLKSKVAGGLAKWCKATYEYAEAWKIVGPKEQKQRELTEKLRVAEEEVVKKMNELQKIKDDIA